MGSTVKPLFSQLGIYEEFQAIGKMGVNVKLLNEDLTTQILVDFAERQKMYAETVFTFLFYATLSPRNEIDASLP